MVVACVAVEKRDGLQSSKAAYCVHAPGFLERALTRMLTLERKEDEKNDDKTNDGKAPHKK